MLLADLRSSFILRLNHHSAILRCLPIICVFISAVHGAEVSKSEELSRAIHALVEQQIKTYNIPGLSIAVSREQGIFFSQSYGWTDVENRVPVTRDTLFPIGSITKTVTATAAMMLASQGKLNLDTPVQRYCASFPDKLWPVTTRDLLRHLGGVHGFHHSGASTESLNNTHYDQVTDSMGLFNKDPLVAEPGTRYEYSDFGYVLVGCVLEGASGKRFDDLLRSTVLKAASMTNTRIDNITQLIPKRSRCYTHAKDGAIMNAACLDTGSRVPAAGLLSTANDLTRFAIALESGKLLNTTVLHTMWSEQNTRDGKPTGYGLGWMIRGHHRAIVAAHTGELPGASTILYVLPQKSLSFAVLANASAAGLWKLADRLADLLDPESGAP